MYHEYSVVHEDDTETELDSPQFLDDRGEENGDTVTQATVWAEDRGFDVVLVEDRKIIVRGNINDIKFTLEHF